MAAARPARLTSLMTRGQRLVFIALAGLWVASLVFFWTWWLRSTHVVTPLGMVANSAMFAWVLLTPGVFLMHVARMARANPALPPPRLRVAMIVTKAPSEPWSLVRGTLRAMLRQQMPYSYDVWLADEAPTDQVQRWCEANGVHLSSRHGRADYHRSEWPRRTRSKEGNLAFFYDHWGYAHYDVVAQFDSDHRPTPTYLANIVRPFADERVGYVAAPSIDDANANACWVVRGRFFKEAIFHGPNQAGAHGRIPPICIGSHYAVRTAALREIGGIGPELAEDLSTSLMMNAFGWRGAFAIDAEAHGDGPETFADLITQEFQWARSVSDLTLRYARFYWHGLGFTEKVKLGFVQAWYSLHGLFMLAATLFPVIAVWTGNPWAHVRLIDFFAHAFVISGVLVLLVEWIGRQGWLRPADAPTVSWEAALYMFTRWPWVLYGVLQSWAGWLTGRRFGFRVTPKNVDDAMPIGLRAVAPYLAICAVCSLTAALQSHPGRARGYYYFCLLDGLVYLTVTGVVLVLHLRENDALSWRGAWGLARAPVIAAVGSAVLLGLAVQMRGGAAIQALLPPDVWRYANHLGAELSRRLARAHAGTAPAGVTLGVGLLLLVEGGLLVLGLRRRAGSPAGRVDRWVRLGLFALLALDCFAFVGFSLSWQHGSERSGLDFVVILAVGIAAGLLVVARRPNELRVDLSRAGAAVPAPPSAVGPQRPQAPDLVTALAAPPLPPSSRARRRQLLAAAEARIAPSLDAESRRLLSRPGDPAPYPDTPFVEIAAGERVGAPEFQLRRLAPRPDDDRREPRAGATAPATPELSARTPDASRAHALLYDRLVLAGWTPEGRGRPWYAHRFQRPDGPGPLRDAPDPPDGEPPQLPA